MKSNAGQGKTSATRSGSKQEQDVIEFAEYIKGLPLSISGRVDTARSMEFFGCRRDRTKTYATQVRSGKSAYLFSTSRDGELKKAIHLMETTGSMDRLERDYYVFSVKVMGVNGDPGVSIHEIPFRCLLAVVAGWEFWPDFQKKVEKRDDMESLESHFNSVMEDMAKRLPLPLAQDLGKVSSQVTTYLSDTYGFGK